MSYGSFQCIPSEHLRCEATKARICIRVVSVAKQRKRDGYSEEYSENCLLWQPVQLKAIKSAMNYLIAMIIGYGRVFTP